MKKLLVILLGFCFALPSFAAGVRAVDNSAWLDHLAKMQIIRQQILSLVTRENPTPEDKALIESLNADFAAQKAEWDGYLVSVSQNQETAATDEVKVEPSAKCGTCPSMSACSDGKEQKKHGKYGKHGKKRWGRHVCGEACKDGCIKPKMKECCGSAMCKEAGKCIRDNKKTAKVCPKGDKCHKVTGIKCDKPCKDCVEESKCDKTMKKACDKANVKACSKGKDCCQVTGKECADQNCDSSKKECKPAKKRWGRHVCGESCENGCIKPKMKDCCGSAMCKEAGKCIRDTEKAAKVCPKGDKCHKVTGIKCDKPCKDCLESNND